MKNLQKDVFMLSIVSILIGSRSTQVGFGSDTGCDWLGRVQSVAQRTYTVSITDFGAVGDGIHVNTQAFKDAISYASSVAQNGGAMLYIPAGRWLTGSFNLTSHFTLFLEENARILGAQDIELWPVIAPLPSYGRGREYPGGRHISLIHGANLQDVVITGNNGTIDGQGAAWWKWSAEKLLNHTRPHLLELISCDGIVISNTTFTDSPFWNIHPVYSRNVLIEGLTILAPENAPNTDGIDPGRLPFTITSFLCSDSINPKAKDKRNPFGFVGMADSCTNVCIQDCYIRNGDDMVAVKSGWDEYGIAFGQPSSNIYIRRISGQTTRSAGIAIGSENSGGISEIYVENLNVFHSKTGVSIRTVAGRGGYISNIFIKNVALFNVGVAISMTGMAGDHPDGGYDPSAIPVVRRVAVWNVTGSVAERAGRLIGLPEQPFQEICIGNVRVYGSNEGWKCVDVEGFSQSVEPPICPLLSNHNLDSCPWE